MRLIKFECAYPSMSDTAKEIYVNPDRVEMLVRIDEKTTQIRFAGEDVDVGESIEDVNCKLLGRITPDEENQLRKLAVQVIKESERKNGKNK